jgi:hypothetical protein
VKSNRLERWAADDALHWQEQANALIEFAEIVSEKCVS